MPFSYYFGLAHIILYTVLGAVVVWRSAYQFIKREDNQRILNFGRRTE